MATAALPLSTAFLLPLRNSAPVASHALQHTSSSYLEVNLEGTKKAPAAGYSLAAAIFACAAAATALRRGRVHRSATGKEEATKDEEKVAYSSFSAGATVRLEEGEQPDSRGFRRPERVKRSALKAAAATMRRLKAEEEREKELDKQERIAAGVPPEAFDRKPNTKRILYNPDFDPSIQVGAMAPLGFFDPIGMSNKGDLNGFRNYRAMELKHGRVAMMAALGAVVQHYVRFPGFESVPAGLGALTKEPGNIGFGVLLVVTGFLETVAWTQDEAKSPGDFGDPLGLGNIFKSEPGDYGYRERELNNGRFAMFAAAGIIFAELATGKDAVEQFGG